MIKKKTRLLMMLVVMSGLYSCYHDADLNFEPPRPTPAPDLLCAADTVYFQNTVYPLINSGCAKSGCHDASTHKAGVVLEQYTDILEHVRPYDPGSSTLYKILYSNSEGRMPPDAPFTAEQKSQIYWWIKQGAQNNRCDNVLCDSSNVTYSSKIAPITTVWCIGCHNATTLSGGFSLETYEEMVACANEDQGKRLMGALNHETGYSPMPKNSTLPGCGIALFRIWMDNNKPR